MEKLGNVIKSCLMTHFQLKESYLCRGSMAAWVQALDSCLAIGLVELKVSLFSMEDEISSRE